MAGTSGAQIIPELPAAPGSLILPKRTYSSFNETGLDPPLCQFGVDIVVLTGQQTNICLRHTATDAFFRGYAVIVPSDAGFVSPRARYPQRSAGPEPSTLGKSGYSHDMGQRDGRMAVDRWRWRS
jgi:nicotinamidase-related amidase